MTRGLFATLLERAETLEAIGLNRLRLRPTRPVSVSLRLNGELDANSGRAIQSVPTKLASAVVLLPWCQVVRVGCATGAEPDPLEAGRVAFLPHPAKRSQTVTTVLMVLVFIKRRGPNDKLSDAGGPERR